MQAGAVLSNQNPLLPLRRRQKAMKLGWVRARGPCNIGDGDRAAVAGTNSLPRGDLRLRVRERRRVFLTRRMVVDAAGVWID